jgi:hypothetical protein
VEWDLKGQTLVDGMEEEQDIILQVQQLIALGAVVVQVISV